MSLKLWLSTSMAWGVSTCHTVHCSKRATRAVTSTEIATHQHGQSDKSLVSETIVVATEVHVTEVVVPHEAAAIEAIEAHVASEVMIEDLAQSETTETTKVAKTVGQDALQVVMMVATDVQVHLVGANTFASTSKRN
jgi:hypothetical protein